MTEQKETLAQRIERLEKECPDEDCMWSIMVMNLVYNLKAECDAKDAVIAETRLVLKTLSDEVCDFIERNHLHASMCQVRGFITALARTEKTLGEA